MFARYRLSDWQSPAFVQWAQQMRSQLPADQQTWLPARQREFLAGRYCAAQALAQLDYPQAEHTLLGRSSQDRRVLWPAGYVGSISHAEQHVVALVARTPAYHAVGIDLEPWMQSGRALALMPRLCTPSEQALLLAQPDQLAAQMTCLFSAKETLYKLLYGDVQQHMTFHSATVVARQHDHWVLELTIAWGSWPAGTRQAVYLQTDAWGVCTWAMLAADASV